MAATTRNGASKLNLEIARVRDQADQVTSAANEITRIANQVAEGAGVQAAALDTL